MTLEGSEKENQKKAWRHVLKNFVSNIVLCAAFAISARLPLLFHHQSSLNGFYVFLDCFQSNWRSPSRVKVHLALSQTLSCTFDWAPRTFYLRITAPPSYSGPPSFLRVTPQGKALLAINFLFVCWTLLFLGSAWSPKDQYKRVHVVVADLDGGLVGGALMAAFTKAKAQGDVPTFTYHIQNATRTTPEVRLGEGGAEPGLEGSVAGTTPRAHPPRICA